MRELAANRKNNLKEPDPTTYGQYPFNPSTWDADRIAGCVADEHGYVDDEFGYHNISAFENFDLIAKSCPFGPHPLANLSFSMEGVVQNHTVTNDIQAIYCNAPAGYFTLAFRGDISSKIAVNSTAFELQRLLQSIPSIGNTKVQIFDDKGQDKTSSSTICSNSHHVEITFLSEVGAKPLLSVHTSLFFGRKRASLAIQRVVKAHGDVLAECSGMGDCDSITGSCVCLNSWGSSDGNMKPGYRGDCGIRLF